MHGAMLLLAAAAALQGAAPAQSPKTAQAAAEIPQARLARARHLVSLVNPTGVMIEKNMQGWEAGITSVLKLNSGLAKIEAQYPGTAKAAVDAARPIAKIYVERFVSAALDSKATIFARRLAPAELEEAISFFESGAGRRFIGRLSVNADPSIFADQLAANAARTGKVGLTAEQIKAGIMPAIAKSSGEASAEDQIEFIRFGQKPLAQKIAQAGTEADRVALDMANNPDPEWLRRQGEAVSAAILSFVDSKKRR